MQGSGQLWADGLQLDSCSWRRPPQAAALHAFPGLGGSSCDGGPSRLGVRLASLLTGLRAPAVPRKCLWRCFPIKSSETERLSWSPSSSQRVMVQISMLGAQRCPAIQKTGQTLFSPGVLCLFGSFHQSTLRGTLVQGRRALGRGQTLQGELMHQTHILVPASTFYC